MNKYFLALAATMLLISCGSNGNFKITGTTPDINNGTYVYLQKIDINNQILNVDTTVIKDGKFSFTEDPVENSELMALSFQKIRGNVFFISENEEISIKAYKDSLYTSEVDGGAENDVFKLYYDDVVIY